MIPLQQTSEVQQNLNQKYSELCQQLGSLSYQRSLLDTQIADLSAQIKSLNTLAPAMRKMELELKTKVAADAAKVADAGDQKDKASSEAG